MQDILDLIGRTRPIFGEDVLARETELRRIVSGSRFLVVGAAGTIGKAVTREIFRRQPKLLHVVDISENNMVELVRDLRSTLGYTSGEFGTFAIDCGGVEFKALMKAGSGYDYVLNLSALKHVRSEKDPFTLMRMVEVNILNTIATLADAGAAGAAKYFCVSTDKAANPVNLMGGSKRIMEKFLMRASLSMPVSTARFANVAFSDGSLLHGFTQRILLRQPISAPNDVRRYFVTARESGELCLMSCLLGENRDVFFPKLSEQLHLITFAEIAERFLLSQGYEPVHCDSEDEARNRTEDLIPRRKWPVHYFVSDTTGEKDFEEFYMAGEALDMDRYEDIGVIKNEAQFDEVALDSFLEAISRLRARSIWTKDDILAAFYGVLPELSHKESGKYLDGRM